ncbi:MAG: hypothetical protein FWF53_09860 [Candidatus Azobacteroides sp.]|nr:hypothetical protein [Candidatus Azobacteroides sp.]
MRKVITIQEAEVLLHKYYEGFTSGEEEKRLCTFLSQKHLPEQFMADKAILNYFASQRKKSRISIIPLLRRTSIAASIVIGLLIVHFLIFDKPRSYAYIDGKKVTNKEQIKEQALASIQSWNNSAGDTNPDELINQQLQLFVK